MNYLDNIYRVLATITMMKFVRMRESVSEDLALRDSANRFFDEIEPYPVAALVVDFTGVKSISRSFAHQYITRKNSSPLTISETNIPQNVENMFRVVSEPAPKPRLVDLRSIKVVSI